MTEPQETPLTVETGRVALRCARDLRASRTRSRDLYDRAAKGGGMTLDGLRAGCRSLRVGLTNRESTLLFALLQENSEGDEERLSRRALALLWKPRQLSLASLEERFGSDQRIVEAAAPLPEEKLASIVAKLVRGARRASPSGRVAALVDQMERTRSRVGEAYVDFTGFQRGVRRGGVRKAVISGTALARLFDHLDRNGCGIISPRAVLNVCGEEGAPLAGAPRRRAAAAASPPQPSPPRSSPPRSRSPTPSPSSRYSPVVAITDDDGEGDGDERARLVAKALWIFQEDLLSEQVDRAEQLAGAAAAAEAAAKPPTPPPTRGSSLSPLDRARGASPMTTMPPPPHASPTPPRRLPSPVLFRAAAAESWIPICPAAMIATDRFGVVSFAPPMGEPPLWLDAETSIVLDAAPARATLDDGSQVWFTAAPPRRMMHDVRQMQRCAELDATLWFDPVARKVHSSVERTRAIMRARSAQPSGFPSPSASRSNDLALLPRLSIGRALQLTQVEAGLLSRRLILASSTVALAVIPQSCIGAMTEDARAAMREKGGAAASWRGASSPTAAAAAARGGANGPRPAQSPSSAFSGLARAGAEARAAAANEAAVKEAIAAAAAVPAYSYDGTPPGIAVRAGMSPSVERTSPQALSATFAAIHRKSAIAKGSGVQKSNSRRRALITARDDGPGALGAATAVPLPLPLPRSFGASPASAEAAAVAEAVRRAGMYGELQERVAEAKSALDSEREVYEARVAQKQEEESRRSAQARSEKRRETINRRKREFLSGARPLPFASKTRANRLGGGQRSGSSGGDRSSTSDAQKRMGMLAMQERMRLDGEARRTNPGSRAGYSAGGAMASVSAAAAAAAREQQPARQASRSPFQVRTDRLKSSLTPSSLNDPARALGSSGRRQGEDRREAAVRSTASPLAAPQQQRVLLPRAPAEDVSGSPFRVRAVFSYRQSEPDELSFGEGEIITVIQGAEEEGWVFGSIGARRGIFPFNRCVPVRT